MLSACCRTFQEATQVSWVQRDQQLEAEAAELQGSLLSTHSPWRSCSCSWQVTGGVVSSVKVQCFAIVSPSENPGDNGLQGLLHCLNTGNLSSFFTSTFSLQILLGPPISVWLTLIAIPYNCPRRSAC